MTVQRRRAITSAHHADMRHFVLCLPPYYALPAPFSTPCYAMPPLQRYDAAADAAGELDADAARLLYAARVILLLRCHARWRDVYAFECFRATICCSIRRGI